MVGPPDVDQSVKSARELLLEIADVRVEVGARAVRLAQHSVLLVSEGGRAEPQCSVRLVRRAGGGEPLERAIDPAIAVELTFRPPYVKVDAQAGERFLDALADALG